MNRLANIAAHGRERIEAWRRSSDDVVLHRSYFYRTRHVSGVPVVVTIYDLIAELFPDERVNSPGVVEARARSIEMADHVLAISETTRRDAIRHYGIDPARITTTPLASGLAIRGSAAGGDRRSTTVLYVGKRDGYKNFDALVDAVGDPAVPPDINLVAYGGGRLTKAEQRRLAEKGLAGRVTHIEPDPAQLDRLYRTAMAYVCPSKYEGFGLPVVEAMERACPVIVADAGALPEVADGAALSFDPDDPAQLTKHIVDLHEQPELRHQLSVAGEQQSSFFSWTRTAETTMAGYRAALEMGS
ncbi:MAG: glycosyltransferase family 4 protein [Acidimicrobiales bacterium]|nr:glycosyltransferase family 4 protein [Acidimicrobiales bacterium]